MIHRNDLEIHLNALLKPEQIKDFCPNGLQIQCPSEAGRSRRR